MGRPPASPGGPIYVALFLIRVARPPSIIDMVGRASAQTMAFLENPPESPCFGCGPRHARGLHLAFQRRTTADGVEEVVCEYTPKSDEVGWPGLMHIGLLFMTMMETSYWTALALGGRVHSASGPMTFEPMRLPRVGKPFRSRARLAAAEGDRLRVTCVAESADGRPHATLSSTWRRATRSSVEKAGLSLPAYLLEDMDP